ncbi:methyltransferase domain-containing protein [uncultured Algibacter sp.]|uniref:class I SAM-dependent methyltransferase n=1 Tax=uncultured Algibacter sp. TaxID=298659 RepID=UPI00262415EC|nr:methyltransferase domain-containing protein [uncultured Algibacter sp.]
MTKYEFFRWITYPVMPVILITVRNDIKSLIRRSNKEKLKILDVGGRKSPYTINLNAHITLQDIPQESETQEQLNLGFTEDILRSIKKKRSNIKDVIIEDMTQSTIKNGTYNAIVSVEVIEHVREDDLFVKNISKAIKNDGWAYFTTPNGDFIKNEGPNKNPDHVRHYTKEELKKLLEKYFKKVEVKYAVKTGKYRLWGLKSFKKQKPISLFKSLLGNLVNRIQSYNVHNKSKGTAHLVAVAYK